MAKIKVVTDSSVQLTPEEIDKYNITVVPLTITIDGQTYTDGVDISREEFVKKMDESKELPKTSQPSIGVFEKVFRELTEDGSQVVGIFLARSLSGTIEAARQAADLIGKSDQISLVDSELTDRAEAYQVLAAAKDAQEGKSLEEILAHIEKLKQNQKLRMIVVNLDNLIKGGRLGPVAGKIATLLNIRIELHMPDGNLDVAKKGRGKKFSKNFDKRILKYVEEHKHELKEVSISYVDTLEDMQALGEKIKEINPDIKVLIRVTSPIIATHAGSGAYAVFYTTEDF
ncbi:DegV family protein [Lactobacillus taiwanensis]|uniref:DegV family protein n=1 Tax=Lactobacillus taiwanensis TaxID=508451 RepID=UPI000B98F85A|nr:DegV family protein [Lactobacillus taiwanensis]OYR95420.1 fatty acid-binding protein DegV [Lactobacillus taiwanensis]OYS00767.1 fatty acid-binding protein DegV [Lactobacillus taiwanensis]OYS15983.1 fatty acid-binding protein DegV [Lactobacillus taiwanensis]OYS31929.1 fatty acid-binding protein DegV [Lactobacillus taiwanensis]OYS32005.1 fatty acid-binding protein DegV [Lactobacillus taiwanensis]